MTIGERIRSIRKETGLNQTDFGEKVGLRQSSLGQIESGVRNATDRTIILICEKYGVREDWLRNGTGEMFLETDSTIVSQLSSEYGIDAFEKVLIEGFLKMKPEERAVIKTYVRNLIDTLTTDEAAYKEFRAEYDKEHALPFAARRGDASGLAEAAERFNNTLSATDDKDGM
ncbi:MAG: helix-turn-helix transcriptional regulator [Provencibacterium sp.]|nr:helix-turn-helix transcriptional regulator [Provencibacterium sp.]